MAAPLALAAIDTSLKGLREKHGKLVAEMTALLQKAEEGDRDLTAEEQTRFDELKAERDGLATRIDRLTEQRAAEAALDEVIPAAGRGGQVQPPARRPNEAATQFESFGEFMHAVRFRSNDQRLTFVENVGAEQGEGSDLRAEMRMDNDTQGGFMVPQQFRSQIMSIAPQDALVRPRATIIPAGNAPDAGLSMPVLDQGGSAPANMFGGVQFAWIEEGGAKPETNLGLGEFTLTPHEVAGHMKITDKLLRNWPAADGLIRQQFTLALAGLEDYVFQRGNGVTQPLGALNAPATKWVPRANANTITYIDIVNMVAVFLMRGGQPVWSMPQQALTKIATMVDPAGHYIWKENARDGFAGTLMGYPVRWNNRAPALGVKGDVLLADWSYYVIKDGSGPFVAASEHVEFLNNKTVIKLFYNVDGAPWMKAPIKEENGYEVSPFVGLDIPA
ncbi:phage major capsid protein [Bosea sp. SSUT16]|uniref:Phage major capsid protein n=2 Tax=Bosea spartocytisi TaxID=2773451 RepID=A0A927EBU1_9HYPH|nr:phage major capsid protein [Bosea spartocytisi]